jgi:hypothetical protein
MMQRKIATNAPPHPINAPPTPLIPVLAGIDARDEGLI